MAMNIQQWIAQQKGTGGNNSVPSNPVTPPTQQPASQSQPMTVSQWIQKQQNSPVSPQAPASTPQKANRFIPANILNQVGSGVGALAMDVGKSVAGAESDVAQGAAKGGIQGIEGLGAVLTNVGGKIEGGLGAGLKKTTGINPTFATESQSRQGVSNFQQAMASPVLQPTNIPQSIGSGIGQTADVGLETAFGAPELGSGEAVDAVLAGKGALKSAARFAGKSVVSGLQGGAMTSQQTGSLKQGLEAVPAFTAVGAVGETWGTGVRALFPSTKQIARNIVGSASIKEDVEKPLDEYINTSMAKAFRKAIGTGKKTLAAVKSGSESLAKGVRTIVENKNILTDEQGNPVGLPKTKKEFATAITKTEQGLFKAYDSIAQSAGKVTKFNSKPVLSSIDKYLAETAGKTDAQLSAMSDLRSEVARHDGASFSQVQDYLAALNKKSGNFITSGSGPDVAQSTASVASEIRKEMYSQVERASSDPAYESLRKQFGAVKSLEKTVAQSIGKEASNRGFEGLYNVFSGEELLMGALTGNPAEVARGVGLQAAKGFLKWYGSADRGIENMFQAVDETYNQAANKGIILKSTPEPRPFLALPPGRPGMGARVENPIMLPSESQSTIDSRSQTAALKGKQGSDFYESLRRKTPPLLRSPGENPIIPRSNESS